MKTRAPSRPYVRLLDWLRAHAVEFEVHEHAAAYTATNTARSEGVDAWTFAKVVGVATDDGRNAFIVVDAPDRVDLRKARAALRAAEVTLLDEAALAELTPGCEPGAMPAVGALFGVPMLADYGVEGDSEISFNAGTHGTSVRVDRAAWERATGVQYADLAVHLDDQPAWARP